MLKFTFRESYTPPFGKAVVFDFSQLTFNFKNESYTAPNGHDVKFDFGFVLPPDYLIKPYGANYAPSIKLDSSTSSKWEKANAVDKSIKPLNVNLNKLHNVWLFGIVRQLDQKDVGTAVIYGGNLDFTDSHYKIDSGKPIPTKDVDTKFKTDALDKLEAVTTGTYALPEWKDVTTASPWHSVNLLGSKRETVTFTYPTLPVGNIVNFDFATAPFTNKLIFDFSVSQPAPNDQTPLTYKTVTLNGRLQPTEVHWSTFAGKAVTELTFIQALKWGYGANNFLIGGVWKDAFVTEPPEPPEPPTIHVNYGVYRVVNIVNLFTYPDMIPINFESLSINYDIDSFCWSANFVVSTEADYNLIRPIGGFLREVLASVNGTNFKFFVGRVNRSWSAEQSTGRVSKTFNCQAWSNLKRLAHPYAAKKSYTSTSATTAAQAVIEIATLSGVTVDWQTVDWNIPANVHSYQDQTPMGAMLQVIKAAGAVIMPDLATDGFTVKPRFPISPWNWNKLTSFPDRLMSEAQFFSIDNETIPKTNPDSIYVMGNTTGVKCVRDGKAGTETLPDIIDKYITSIEVGQERGRNEVAANSFIEVVPMVTYVDENGLIMPLELIEFTEFGGGKWRGQVLSTTISIQRIGTGITQSITVGRFHDE